MYAPPSTKSLQNIARLWRACVAWCVASCVIGCHDDPDCDASQSACVPQHNHTLAQHDMAGVEDTQGVEDAFGPWDEGAASDMSAAIADQGFFESSDMAQGGQGARLVDVLSLSTAQVTFARAVPGVEQVRLVTLTNTSGDRISLEALGSTLASELSAEWVSEESPRRRDARRGGVIIPPDGSILLRLATLSPRDDMEEGSDPPARTISLPLGEGVAIDVAIDEDVPCIALSGVYERAREGGWGYAINLGEFDLYEGTRASMTILNCSPTRDLSLGELYISRDPHDALTLEQERDADGTPRDTVIAPGSSFDLALSIAPVGSEGGALNYALLPLLGQITLRSDAPDFVRTSIDLMADDGEDRPGACAPLDLEVGGADGALFAMGSSSDDIAMLHTAPLEHLTFIASTDGQASAPRPTVEVEWSVLSRPTRSLARFTESMQQGMMGAPSSLQRSLFLDVPGEYVIEVRPAPGAQMRADCPPIVVEMRATPAESLYVSTVWETPGDLDPDDRKGADLDLHYIHPQGTFEDEYFDVFWRNPSPDWGEVGAFDDPVLLRDDQDGHGPEVLAHEAPLHGLTYTVGVHYFEALNFGVSFVTTHIYIHGVLTAQSVAVPLDGTGAYLRVGEVTWSTPPSVTLDGTITWLEGE